MERTFLDEMGNDADSHMVNIMHDRLFFRYNCITLSMKLVPREMCALYLRSWTNLSQQGLGIEPKLCDITFPLSVLSVIHTA